MIDWDNMKLDKRPKKNYWAPGDYTGRCVDCGCWFMGDKRATQCADCAYSIEEELVEAPFDWNIPNAESKENVVKAETWHTIDPSKIKTFDDIFAIFEILEIGISSTHDKFYLVEDLLKDE